jgi:hypothetical protein
MITPLVIVRQSIIACAKKIVVVIGADNCVRTDMDEVMMPDRDLRRAARFELPRLTNSTLTPRGRGPGRARRWVGRARTGACRGRTPA